MMRLLAVLACLALLAGCVRRQAFQEGASPEDSVLRPAWSLHEGEPRGDRDVLLDIALAVRINTSSFRDIAARSWRLLLPTATTLPGNLWGTPHRFAILSRCLRLADLGLPSDRGIELTQIQTLDVFLEFEESEVLVGEFLDEPGRDLGPAEALACAKAALSAASS